MHPGCPFLAITPGLGWDIVGSVPKLACSMELATQLQTKEVTPSCTAVGGAALTNRQKGKLAGSHSRMCLH
jgi:hypothetical protein